MTKAREADRERPAWHGRDDSSQGETMRKKEKNVPKKSTKKEKAAEVAVVRTVPTAEAKTAAKTANENEDKEAKIQGQVKGRAFGSPLARGLYPRASTAEVDPRARPGPGFPVPVLARPGPRPLSTPTPPRNTP